MLKYLLKYDLKWTYKVITVFYGLALFFSLLSFWLSKAGHSTLMSVLYQLCCGITVAMVANCVTNCVIRSWVRFRNNMYKDESYLTHTLPVSKSTLFLSKTLSALICSFISTAVSVVCIVLCYYNNDVVKNSVKSGLDLLANSFDVSEAVVLVLLVFIIFLELMFILLTGYNGIILGHKSNKGKMVKSLIIGFIMYLVFNLFTFVIICAAGLFDDRIKGMITTADTVDMAALKICLFLAAGVYIIYIFVLYVIGNKFLNKGVNID